MQGLTIVSRFPDLTGGRGRSQTGQQALWEAAGQLHSASKLLQTHILTANANLLKQESQRADFKLPCPCKHSDRDRESCKIGSPLRNTLKPVTSLNGLWYYHLRSQSPPGVRSENLCHIRILRPFRYGAVRTGPFRVGAVWTGPFWQPEGPRESKGLPSVSSAGNGSILPA